MGWGQMAAAGVSSIIGGIMDYSAQKEQIAAQQQSMRHQASVLGQQAAQNQYEAKVAEANAKALDQQAKIEAQKGLIEAEKLQDEREQVRRAYDQTRGENIAMLASSNVDLATGSAFDLLKGNANWFAEDLGNNTFNKMIAEWQAKEAVKQSEFQANLQRANSQNSLAHADYYTRMSNSYADRASSLKPSLLKSFLVMNKQFLDSM